MHIGLFLDRDGTINEEVEFLSSPHNVRLLPGAARAIREANALGLIVVIITNQSGIARGFFTEEDLRAVNEELLRQLEHEGARIDAMFYCPHHPDGDPPYREVCECRKPNIALFRRAAEQFGIDLTKSFMIGDRLSDLQAGNNIGAASILVRTGYGEIQLPAIDRQSVRIDYIAQDLWDAFGFVKTRLEHTRPLSSPTIQNP